MSKSDDPRPSPREIDYQDLFDHAPSGQLLLSPGGEIVLANERIATWVGQTKGQLVGRHIHDLLSVGGRIFYETSLVPLLHLQGAVDEVAIDLLTGQGTRMHCLLNATEQRGRDGRLLFTRVSIFKATERRRYERDLVDTREAAQRDMAAERETSQLREQFIAVLGHDLRNPLASIGSGIRLLTERETFSDKGRRVLSLMHGSVMRASELIENVLDFARGRLGGGITLSRDTSSPLTPVLEQVVAEIASISPDHEIHTRFYLEEPIDCDRTRLGQLLSNLLGNAVTHGARSRPIVVQAAAEGGAFVLSVANGGSPIEAAAMERLFQPFFRGEIRPNLLGLGLGLHIASEIAKAHDGALSVVSDDRETCFTFTMPLRTAMPAPDVRGTATV